MSLGDAIRNFFALTTLPGRELTTPAGIVDVRRAQQSQRIWRTSSIAEALEVPAIQRAVTLIANTTGSLTMQGYRNGELMADTPRLIARPDPNLTPRDFYVQVARNMAASGEAVMWIASRDPDSIPSALVNVPLTELDVQENPANRLRPTYRWRGTGGVVVEGTRYTPANPNGAFVHVMYLPEPLALRGKGPLQMAGAAISVAVEAQQWAANFYADGGQGGTIIKHAGYLSSDEDEAQSEVDTLRNQWVDKPNNIPRVIDQSIDSVTSMDVNPQSAQMLEARDYQNGDAARLFGIPGALLEFAQSGTSLTYQTIESVWTNFLRGCLAPNYLEPIEQAMSDLLTRSTAARFNVAGLGRADAKTRAEVYNILIALGVMTTEEARQAEGWAPGNVEFAPVLPSPPNVGPMRLTQPTGPLRCMSCGYARFVVEDSSRFKCVRCKTLNGAAPEPISAAQPPPIVINNNFQDGFIRSETHIDAPQITTPPTTVTFADGAFHIENTVEPSPVMIAEGAFRVDVTTPDVTVPITVEPTQVTVEPAQVTVEPAQVHIDAPITVEAAQLSIAEGAIQVDSPVTVEAPAAPRALRRRVTKEITRNPTTHEMVRIVETEESA